NTAESLRRLWGCVGYEYNRKRAGLAALAVQYLKHKQKRIGEREGAVQTIVALRRQGLGPNRITRQLAGVVNKRFVERILYEREAFVPRIGKDFPTFPEYCASAGAGLSPGGVVWERIADIRPVEDYHGDVYDFTVDHADHNFV